MSDLSVRPVVRQHNMLLFLVAGGMGIGDQSKHQASLHQTIPGALVPVLSSEIFLGPPFYPRSRRRAAASQSAARQSFRKSRKSRGLVNRDLRCVPLAQNTYIHMYTHRMAIEQHVLVLILLNPANQQPVYLLLFSLSMQALGRWFAWGFTHRHYHQ